MIQFRICTKVALLCSLMLMVGALGTPAQDWPEETQDQGTKQKEEKSQSVRLEIPDDLSLDEYIQHIDRDIERVDKQILELEEYPKEWAYPYAVVADQANQLGEWEGDEVGAFLFGITFRPVFLPFELGHTLRSKEDKNIIPATISYIAEGALLATAIVYWVKAGRVEKGGLDYDRLANRGWAMYGGSILFGVSTEVVCRIRNKKLPGIVLARRQEISALERRRVYLAGQLEMLQSQQRALPCELLAEVDFDDTSSRNPNKTLDGKEAADIIVELQNRGEGAGYEVVLHLVADNRFVQVQGRYRVGEIRPGSSRIVHVPIQADLNAPDGTATITIETKEKRGYDARPIKLRIPVAHLDKPVLEIASVDLNDGSGLAEGNGNGMPENNERIELVAFVRNRGVGEAQDVTVKVVSLNSDLTPVQTEDRLSTILPGQTERARFSFSIPRLFSDPTIRYRLEAEDALGASQTGRSFEIPFQQNVPILAYETRILDAQGSSVESLTNDEEFVWEITPSNTGQNAAQEVRISVRANQPGIRFDRSRSSLGELAPGQRGASEHFRFQIPRTFAGTEAVLQLELGQSEFDSKHEEKTIPVRLRRPRLLETHELVDANRNGVIEQGEMVTFSVRVRNEGDLDARDVKVGLDVPKEWVEFEDEKLIGTLLPGESQTVSFDILIKGRTEVGDLPVHLAVHQSDGFGDIEETLSYAVTEMQARVEVVEGERQERAPTAVAPAMLNLEPLVTIAFPVDGSTVREETVRFEGAATARGERKRIVSTVVTVNGVRQGLKDRRGLSLKSREGIAIESVGEGQVQFTGYLRLREGANTIRVKALDNDNLSFEKTVTVTRQGKMPTLWAVVVGVSRYQDEQLNLRYADRDARAFYDFLRTPAGGGLDDEHIVLLTNEQATHDQILGRLTNFLRQAQEEDAVILFLACHGVIDAYGELYFLGHNSDQDNLIGTAVAQDDLMKVVGRVIKAQKKVLYIDACHSGEFGMSPTLAMRDDRARLTNKLVLKIAEADPSLAIFSASGGSEFSREDQRWGGGHGVFTYYLLKGLRGEANADGNDMVTIGELEDYLRREVGRATDNKQRPEVKGWRKAEFPLSVVK